MAPASPSPRDRSAYLAEDTIAAISSAVGGAVAIVRVSGPRAFDILEIVTGSSEARHSEPRKLRRARLLDESGEPLDDALFVRFVRPESYSGEDLVEYHVHGGAFIAARLLERLARAGARQALPGEFSFRAVRNGKMSLAQAQAVADLIAASNESAVSLALEKMSGTQNRLLHALSESLRHLAVLAEAGIDFADQDIDEVGLPALRRKLAPQIQALERLFQSFGRGFRVQHGVGVAFTGLPNAGKSSFFNALLGEDRSIVSEIAGTTRDVIRERITLRGTSSTVTLRLEDTAGLRCADNEIERIGIERTRKSVAAADLVLFLIDPSQPLSAAQEQWIALGSPAQKALGILTKIDSVPPAILENTLRERETFGISRWIATSAHTGAGITEAIDAIVGLCERLLARERGEVLLTRQDHAEAASAALEHLRRAESAPGLELFAADLRQALRALGPLIGETLADDILGKIFSDFCIGK